MLNSIRFFVVGLFVLFCLSLCSAEAGTLNLLPPMAIAAAGACPQTDISGDCRVDMDDLVMFAEYWLDPAGSLADFAGNDGVNTSDFVLLAQNWLVEESPVIINEIHYNPDLAQELVEFVELYNLSASDVDISGWQFTNGITYTFPAGTTITAGGYLVAAEDPTPAYVDVTLTSKYGTSAALVKGPFAGNLSNEGETITLSDALGNTVDKVEYQLGFPWPTVGDALTTVGTGASIQLVNSTVDNDLGGNWRSAYPTPGAANTAVYTANNPPCIRQVEHTPNQPEANELVTVTAKVTDTDGVNSVMLKYQLVDPGNYIPITLPLSATPPTQANPDYENAANWTSVAMHDDGLNGDVEAGDEIYTAQLSAAVQTHRRLVRYRITAADAGARSITVPYADDPQPNFAYFVYNGLPSWTGSGVTYTPEVLGSLPVYHLIARNTDIENCFWNQSWNDGLYHFVGTMIYDGKVYDHIYYHIRGIASTYRWGKNKCRFNFNCGHKFQARDDYGRKYDNAWDNLVLGTGTCPWWQYPHPGGSWDVGTGGMMLNEPLGYRLYNLAGVPSPNTSFFHFRVIDGTAESGATQYEGDFWGMYFAIENPDGRFLEEHNLADGNVFKMEVGSADQRNQGPTQVTDDSDVWAFINGQTTSSTQAWWESNVNLDGYYSFKTVGIVTNNSDPRPQENCFYFHNPLTNKWSIHPWDLDLNFEWATHYTDWEHVKYCLNYSALNIAYQNRARELVDLLFDNEHYGWRQTDQLVDEMAAVVANSYDGLRFIDAERAMWESHPRVNYKNLWYKNNEWFVQPGHELSWDYMVAYYKQFLTPTGMSGFLSGSYGLYSLNSSIADTAIPNTPTITYTGSTGYPVNDLKFQTSAFSAPSGGGAFTASKWRIAEVEPYTPVAYVEPGQPYTIDLITANETWNYFRAISAEPSNPVEQWRTFGFDDSSWQSGQTSIGYGDNDDSTNLASQTPAMQNTYTTIYLRKTFNVENLYDIESFNLRVYVDDGCIIWINGTELPRQNCSGEFKAWDATNGTGYVEPAWYTITLPTPYSNYFVEGDNIIAVHVLNESKSSSDLSIDLTLTATYSAAPSDPVPPQKVKRGKYEIETLWESPEIANSSQLTVQIPASVVKPGKMYRVRCRMKDSTGRWSHWSDPNQFAAGVPLSVGILEDLRITEVMYNPPQPSAAESAAGFADNDEFEFIEIKNRSVDETLDLTYVALTNGVTFSFAGSAITSLEPGQFTLVVKNPSAFNLRYPGLSGRIAGTYTGSLNNAGEAVELVDTLNGTIADFDYNDGYGWPISVDGSGHSMIPLESALPGQPNGSLRYCGNWRASTYIKGSPGADDPTPIASILINEVMAHTDFDDDAYPDYDSNDWIELYNPTGASIAYGGNWYLSDDPDNLKKWALPAGSIAAGGRVSFDELTGFHSPVESGFGLDKTGEYVLLSCLPGNSSDRVVDYVKFGGQYNTVSTGRYPDGGAYWFFLANPGTRDTANVNPVQRSVVISEIMYNPSNGTTNEEYIELYNTTGSAVNLYNAYGTWRLDNAVTYSFPSGTSIPATGSKKIVVVPFDPAVETTRLAAFNATYGCSLAAGTTIFGPWTGDLSNGGERIALQEPQEADPPQTPATWWIITDQVIYGDYAPWVTGPDGTGTALIRSSSAAAASGDNPSSWTAAAPSPGY